MGYHFPTAGDLISRLVQGEQMRLFLDTCPTALVIFDEEGSILGLGHAAEALFGFTEAELVGRNVDLLMRGSSCIRPAGSFAPGQTSAEEPGKGAGHVAIARDKAGRLFPVELSLGEGHSDAGRYVLCFFRESPAGNCGRERAIGVAACQVGEARAGSTSALGAMIVNALNHPLTAITNYTEGVRQRLEKRGAKAEDEEIIAVLGTCTNHAIRSGELLHRLRELMKGSGLQLAPVTVAELVDSAIRLASNEACLSHQLEARIADDLPEVMVDRSQCVGFLGNLLRHLLQAKPARSDEKVSLRITAQLDNGFVLLSLCDSTTVRAPAPSQASFTANFPATANAIDLDMAIAREIVSAQGGLLWTSGGSSPCGSNVFFTLPIARDSEGGA